MDAATQDVLVTGASGDLGQHVVAELLDAGYTVRALVAGPSPWLEERDVELHGADLFDERALHRAARGAAGLVHCAGAESLSRGEAARMRRTLVEGTAAVLRAARRRGLDRIVHVSSMYAVGMRRDGAPMDEETPWRGAELPRVAALHARREAEERVRTAARAGLPAVVVNPDVLVGPRADGRPRETLAAFRRGASAARIADVARGCRLALERGVPGRRYVLGGTNVRGNELIDLSGVASPTRVPPPIAHVLARWTDSPPLDALRLRPWTTCADSGRAREELGYDPAPLTRP